MIAGAQARAPRAPLDAETVVFLNNRQLVCQAGNISRSGMLLYPPERGRVGQYMRLVFALPGAGHLDADALLVREAKEHQRYAWGVQFLQAPAHVQQLLDGYVTGQTAKRPEAAPARRSARAKVVNSRLDDGWDKALRDVPAVDVKPADEEPPLHDEYANNDPTPLRRLYRKALDELFRRRKPRPR